MNVLISFTIPMVAPSLNKFYSGMHYHQRSRLARDWHEMVKVVCKNKRIKPITHFPVSILTKRFTKSKRLLDTSNTCIANKLIEDGLVKAGILPNDTPEYVTFSGQGVHSGGGKEDFTACVVFVNEMLL